MASSYSRHWYQFSLRSLLLLMTLLSIPPGVYVGYRRYLVAKRFAEIEAGFRWLESLDYPHLPNGATVRVTTKYWRGEETSSEAKTVITHGFLLNEDAKGFTILSPSLKTINLEREHRDEWYKYNSSFDQVPLRTVAREVSEVDENDRRFGRDSSERAELFVLAWACAKQGQINLAVKLYDMAESRSNWNDKEDAPLTFLQRLQADFGYMETWRATLDFEGDLPRAELLKKFRWLQRHFPNSTHAASVAETVANLEAMVAEDERHAKERAARPFSELSPAEQIADLVFQLRDQNGRQFSQPGWCDVLMTGNEDSPGHKLLAYEYEAIPALAAALSDKRLTRSVGYHRNFYFSHRVLTVGEAASQILYRITNRDFDEPSDGETTDRIEAMQKNALAWYSELKAKGERRTLIEAVERADSNCVNLAYRLREKYPDEACTAILTAIERAEEHDRTNLVELLGGISTDVSIPFLLAEMQHAEVFMRVTAAEALTALGRPEGIAEMLRQWRIAKRVEELNAIGPFLAGCRSQEALDALAARFSELEIDARLETLEKATELGAERRDSQPQLETALVKLLFIALKDEEVRNGMSIGYGDKSISDPRVCDMAGHHLNSLDPATYPFDLGASYNQRETERIAILSAVPIP